MNTLQQYLPTTAPPNAPESEVAVDNRDLASEAHETSVDLPIFESEKALKASAKIVGEAKALEKNIQIFKDDKEQAYLVSKVDEVILHVGTCLGSIGGGVILKPDEDSKRCWDWTFPSGDKSLVQLARVALDDDVASKGPKYQSGTLYAIVRDIESTSATPPKLTSFGALLPSGAVGRHEYLFEHPRTSEKHEPLAFVPTAGGLNPSLP